MKYWLLMFLACFAVSTLADDADARRFGGGASFGKQRMHSPAHSGFTPRQAAPARNGNQRGSAQTGMMGMLGGLALGGLLGAMFFGGAFEGINLFDIIVLGALAAVLLWFFRRKAGPAGLNRGHDAAASASGSQTGRMLRPQIDHGHFIQAAKDIFMRMQRAWDARDMDEIRRFCTPDVAAHIENEMRHEERNRTEVATLDASVSDSWIENGLEWVAVDFVAMIRETTDDGSTPSEISHEVRESWIFTHDPASDDPTWYLAGIQQA